MSGIFSVVSQHLAHPFTYKDQETLSANKQKALIISSIIVGLFTLGIGGIALF